MKRLRDLYLQVVRDPRFVRFSFYGVFVPLSRLANLARLDLLKLGFDRNAKSYWVEPSRRSRRPRLDSQM